MKNTHTTKKIRISLTRNFSILVAATLLITNCKNNSKKDSSDSAGNSTEKTHGSTDELNTSHPSAGKLELTTSQHIALSDSLAFITDDAKRLEVLRNQLDINISNEAYQAALKNYGYQVNSQKLMREIQEAYLSELSEADLKAYVSKMIPQSGYPEEVSSYFLAQLRNEISGYSYSKDTAIERDRLNQTLLKAKKISDESFRKQDIREILIGLAKIAPSEAIEHYVSLGADNTDANTLVEIMEKWSIKDPDAALAWMLKMNDFIKKEGARSENLKKEGDKYEKEDDFFGRLLTKVVPAWYLKNANADIDKTGLNLGLISSGYRDEIMVQVLRNLAAVGDPVEAMRRAKNLKGDAMDDTAYEIIQVWAFKAPRQAADWLSQLPKDDLLRQEDYFLEIGINLGRIDFKAGENLLGQISDEEYRNSALFDLITQNWPSDEALRLANELPEFDPIQVIMWAKEISTEPGSKDVNAFKKWFKQAMDEGRIEQPFIGSLEEFQLRIMETIDEKK